MCQKCRHYPSCHRDHHQRSLYRHRLNGLLRIEAGRSHRFQRPLLGLETASAALETIVPRSFAKMSQTLCETVLETPANFPTVMAMEMVPERARALEPEPVRRRDGSPPTPPVPLSRQRLAQMQ